MQWTTNKVLRSQLVGEKTQSDYIPLGLSIKSEGQHTGAYTCTHVDLALLVLIKPTMC